MPDPEQSKHEKVSYTRTGPRWRLYSAAEQQAYTESPCEALTRPVMRFNPSDGKQSAPVLKAYQRASTEFWVSQSDSQL